MNMPEYDIIIVGGGAAGFFAAINCASANPKLSIVILERGKDVLSKVKISGGGRCNVTHAQFIPDELVTNYPRGDKELRGPFHTFMTGDTISWFEDRDVPLKIEEDGRMFPVSDSSQTIIDCFSKEVQRLGIQVLRQHAVQKISKQDSSFHIETSQGQFKSSHLIVCSGSNPKMWKQLATLKHTITPAVPSLFTFNCKDQRLEHLMGVATTAHITILDTKLESEGPLLITHWGLSGPAVLKLSAWGARVLEKLKYRFSVAINWLEYQNTEETYDQLLVLKHDHAKQSPYTYSQFDLPKRLWRSLLKQAQILEQDTWATLNKQQLQLLAQELTAGVFEVNGKSTFKEEFVTAGGVDLKEINFKTFESKKVDNLYLAGEVLNIDAITGGFNFQAAWTGGYVVAQAIAHKTS